MKPNLTQAMTEDKGRLRRREGWVFRLLAAGRGASHTQARIVDVPGFVLVRALRRLAMRLAAVLLASTGSITGATPQDGIANFKAFIESPLPVREVVYSHYYPGRTNTYKPTYTLARWQKGSFFRMISEDPESLQDPPGTDKPWRGRVDCSSAGVWWKAEGTHREVMIWDANSVQRPVDNPVKPGALASLQHLASFMNMGIEHAPIGSIRWNGDTFASTNASESATWILSGGLVADSAGRAGHLDLSLTLFERNFTRPRRFRWRIDYTYEKSLSPSFLPDRITTWLLDGDQSRVLDEYDVSKIEIADRTLPNTAFDVAKYEAPGWTIYYVSNRGTFSLAHGKWQERLKPGDRRIVSRGPLARYRALYWAIVVLLLAPLVAYWRGGARRTKLEGSTRNTES